MIWSKSLRSITSRCSGNEAAVLPRTLRGEDRERAAGIEPSKNPVKPNPQKRSAVDIHYGGHCYICMYYVRADPRRNP